MCIKRSFVFVFGLLFCNSLIIFTFTCCSLLISNGFTCFLFSFSLAVLLGLDPETMKTGEMVKGTHRAKM